MHTDSNLQIGDWKILNSMDQLDEIDRDSVDHPIVLFKHSVTCGISSGAKYRLETDWDSFPEGAEFYYLDLLAYRSISNEIASRYGVTHQSPQIIVVKDGKAQFDTSHHAIDVAGIRRAVDQ